MNHQDIKKLKSWFCSKKRNLPWRERLDPYSIWISEVMLQQTQVSVVIPYFLHWMEQFPTIRHLANAPLDDLLKAWEGLGYYSRVRHLHEAAGYVVDNFNGILPAEETELKKIKGLGPYTIGAILSFAFHQKKAAVDGNVVRVLTRFFGIEDDISKPLTLKKLRQSAEDLLPDEEPWIVNEALIELGAIVCKRKPNCQECPLQESCSAFQHQNAFRIPFKSKKNLIECLYRSVAVVSHDSSYLVKRGAKGAVMSDLYEFPYFEGQEGGISSNILKDKVEYLLNLSVQEKGTLAKVDQGFTRYQATLYPVLYSCSEAKKIEGFEWIPSSRLKKLAFSSGHRRIFQQVCG